MPLLYSRTFFTLFCTVFLGWMRAENDSSSYSSNSNTKNHRGKLCASKELFCPFTWDALNFWHNAAPHHPAAVITAPRDAPLYYSAQ